MIFFFKLALHLKSSRNEQEVSGWVEAVEESVRGAAGEARAGRRLGCETRKDSGASWPVEMEMVPGAGGWLKRDRC
jgi:hypothetical protein